MKLRGHLGIALTTLLFAAGTASAQDPTPPQQSIQPAPQTTTVIVQPTPAPTPPPAPVVVEPQPERRVVTSDVPVTEETEEEWNAPMFTTGALVFAGSYGASVIVAGTSDRKGDQRLYVPVLGPWLDLADRGSCPISQQSCDSETTNKVLLVADGVFQAAGLLAMIDGIFVPVHHKVTTVQAIRDYKKVHIAPVSYGHGSPGLTVLGHF